MKKQADILTQYAKIDEVHVDALLQEELRRNRKKLVVLDDDPTGVQTVHDVSVYTHWTPEDLAAGFQEEENLFYVLTNSRGFTEAETIKAHREIAEATDKAAKAAGKEYLFVSRSDSTLRGHFPLETEILREEYEKNTGLPVDGEILCPFFKEGGRFTLDNIHYVKYGEELVPANETEFAKDPTFGYVSKTLPEYVEEKTGGKFRKEAVTCISLKDLHGMNYDRIQQQLMDVKNFNKVVVNAVDYPDLKVFCVALLLLLISFVMQQRNHLALQDLNQSISVSQDVADLQMENQKLQYELKEKEDQAGDLQAQLEKAEKQAQALEWLRRIEAAVRTSYPEARTLVEEFEKTGLESSLPTESVVEGGTAPAEAYRSIYAMLF